VKCFNVQDKKKSGDEPLFFLSVRAVPESGQLISNRPPLRIPPAP